MQFEDDDFMNQEQYVLELPPELTRKTEDPQFQFDLVFDESGTSGNFITNLPSNDQKVNYIFRVFTLPLVTESYTSTNNDIFFKNADVSQIIIVYNPTAPPQVLKDYETYQQLQLYKMSRGAFPTGDVLPHGLTPPSRWAPMQLYPQFPVRPKFGKPTGFQQTTVSYQEEIKGEVSQKLQNQKQQMEKKMMEINNEITSITQRIQDFRRDGHPIEELQNELVTKRKELDSLNMKLRKIEDDIKKQSQNIIKEENEEQ